MRKYHTLIISPIILLAIAFGAYRWADVFQRSILAYRSPLAGIAIDPGQPLAAQTHRVVLVVVSGLSYQQSVMQDMPVWQSLASIGASAPMTVRSPAYWPSVWSTLLTGAWPELNDAPLLDTVVSGVRPASLDHLLAVAKDAGLQVAVAAAADRAPLLVDAGADATLFAQEGGVSGDAQVAEAALEYIADEKFSLIIVHLNQPAETGHSQGVGSRAYAGALRQIDSYLRQITRQMDLSNSVLMLVSDGALLKDGRPAGGQRDAPELPLVMVGQHVIAGSFSPVRLIDVAPTVSSLLGTRLPSASQGHPLSDMLQIDEQTLSGDELLVAAHKVALADAYIAAIGQPGSTQLAHDDLGIAVQSLQSGNHAGAFELAGLVTVEADEQMVSAKAARVSTEQNPRLAPLTLGLVVPLLLLWARRPPHLVLSVFCGFVALGVFYGLYILEGNTFSYGDALSAGIGSGVVLARNAAVGLALGTVLFAIGTLSDEQHRWLPAVSTTYSFGLVVCYLSLLPALFGYWQHGAWISWRIPDPTLVAVHGLALHQLGVVAVMSAGLPWLVGAGVWGVGRRRAQAAGLRAQAWDPIAHLRR
jgi:hypothetical protein